MENKNEKFEELGRYAKIILDMLEDGRLVGDKHEFVVEKLIEEKNKIFGVK